MGRKRKEHTKQDLTLSVDKKIVNKLNEHNINKSYFFTTSAELLLEKLENEKNVKKEQN